MYVEAQTIITAGSVLAVIVTFGGLLWGFFKWLNKQNNQDAKIDTNKEQMDKEIREIREDFKNELQETKTELKKEISDLRDTHNKDRDGIQEEQTLVIYGLLACLKGLAEQGCDGAVSGAIDRIERYINKKAHSQE